MDPLEINSPSSAFRGSQRFSIRRRLGAGGMGVVYEAYDRERGETIAVKTLLHAEASGIYRLKKEFRTLADIVHPNLVCLYELMAEGDQWFFSMELVTGMSFLQYVRPNTSIGDANDETTSLHDVDDPTALETNSRPLPSPGEFNPQRLWSALRQLAQGVSFLHEMGIVHRDLKPSNVMVTNEGRVVVLDFGLAAEVTPRTQLVTIEQGIVGTVAYMSPEQADERPITAASDWYTVGVMLYEALTGQKPHAGSPLQVLRDKLTRDPVPPDRLVNGLPGDLVELCMALLRREPARRPQGPELLQLLGAPPTSSAIDSTHTARHDVGLMGRHSHLSALEDAFAATQTGQGVSLYVHGPSGMGKTTLIQHFLNRLTDEQRAVVLAGRCYERESVPYKALDGVVDSLSRYLLSLPQAKAEALMPRDVLPLSRLFPVLLRVEAVTATPHREQEIPDPLVLRRRAFTALRELLARITDRQPLVLYIDDLQWADADSTTLLEDLLRPPDPPPLLLVASFRSEEIESKPFLKLLLKNTGTASCRELSVGPLTPEDARGLACALLGPDSAGNEKIIGMIVREAAGSPFFVEQLTRYALDSETSATTGISLAEMIEARMRRLPVGARELLQTLAVAGRPVDPKVAHEAAGLEGDDRPLVAALRAVHLLRSSGTVQRVELYHDRIRETLAGLLGAQAVRQIHRSLAHTLESKGYDDPEALFEHYLAAGEQDRAAGHAVLAARKATAALAFDRAALFYRRTLELAAAAGLDLLELRAGLGDALTNAGRSVEAAQVYLEAAKSANASKALEYQRRAAEQLLISGHIDEGLAVTRTVLAAVGMKLPATPRRALLAMLLRRAQLRLRGLKFIERPASEVPEPEMLRVDTCWAVAAGLALVDIIRAADFQTRHLLLALRIGEPYRIARALAVEAGFVSTPGRRGMKRAAELSHAAESLARKVNHPHAIGLATMTAGLGAFCAGQWKKAATLCERAEEILRDQCTGVAWELTTAQNFLLGSLQYLGELSEISRRLPVLFAAAQERGNLYAANELRSRQNLSWLAAHDPDGARREVAGALERWTHKGFHRQHYNFLLAQTQLELYLDNGPAAWKRVTDQWQALAGSLLLRIQVLRVEAMHLHARCALAVAVATRKADQQVYLRVAERQAKRIERERMPWCDPFVPLIRASVTAVRGDRSAATALLSVAADGFTAADMRLYAAAVRRRLGELLGGQHGQQLIAEVDGWMASQGIKNPTCMTRMLTPGFPGLETK